MKEKVKAAPKELVRRGLDDGTERLRGQLRETAQRGQASDYGGDRIEDTAARGAYQARRGVEALLKKKKSARDRLPDEEPHTPDSPAPPESPSELPLESTMEPPSKPPAGRSPESPVELPSPHDPPIREQPRIKTREAVSAREGGAWLSESGGARLSPGERMRQVWIKTRESAVHSPRPDVPPAPQAGSEPPQIRTRRPLPVIFLRMWNRPHGRDQSRRRSRRGMLPLVRPLTIGRQSLLPAMDSQLTGCPLRPEMCTSRASPHPRRSSRPKRLCRASRSSYRSVAGPQP